MATGMAEDRSEEEEEDPSRGALLGGGRHALPEPDMMPAIQLRTTGGSLLGDEPLDLTTGSGHHGAAGAEAGLLPGDAEALDPDAVVLDLERFMQDEFVREALRKGADLRQYAKQIEAELFTAEASAVPEFVAQSGAVRELEGEIDQCDAVLQQMQDLLHGFQRDLGGISDEIRHLQDESLSMSVKLRNRKSAELRLFECIAGR